MLVVVIVMAADGRVLTDQTNRRKLPRGGEVFNMWKLPGTSLCHSANIEWMVFAYERIDMHDAGKITTTGEAEEGSTHKHRLIHVYKLMASHLLSLDTIFVPWEFSRLQAWMRQVS